MVAVLLRARRHRWSRDLRAGRRSRGCCRRCDLERISVCIHPRNLHRGFLCRAGHQVSTGRRIGHLRKQRLQEPVRELYGCLRCCGSQPHFGERSEPCVLRRLSASVHKRAERSRRACVCGGHRVHQLLRHLRVGQTQPVFTCIEITGLVLIVVIGIVTLGSGTGEPARAFEFKEGVSLIPAILTGTVLAFYALIGFDDSVNVAEEVRHPSRIYPRAIFGGLLAAGIVYLFVTFTASMVVPTAQLSADGPARRVEWTSAGGGGESTVRATAQAIRAHRAHRGLQRGTHQPDHGLQGHLWYGDQDVLPEVFSNVHPGRRTPWVAILFATLVVLTLLSTIGRNPDALDTLSTTTVVLLLLAFIMVNISVLALRGDEVGHDHFRTPTVFPVLGIAVAAGLLIYTAIDDWTVFGLAAL